MYSHPVNTFRSESAPAPGAKPPRLVEHPEDAAIRALAMSYRVVWQVEMDKPWRQWMDYAPVDQRIAEDAWSSETNRVRVAQTDWSDGFVLDFTRLLQLSESGTQRRIRRVLITT